MGLRGLGIASAICIAATYGAYTEHREIDPVADAKSQAATLESMARSAADSAMKEQFRCLSEDPHSWCNRDMTYEDHLRGARAIAKEVGSAYNLGDGHWRSRNGYGLFALISGLIALAHVRGLIQRIRSHKTSSE